MGNYFLILKNGFFEKLKVFKISQRFAKTTFWDFCKNGFFEISEQKEYKLEQEKTKMERKINIKGKNKNREVE